MKYALLILTIFLALPSTVCWAEEIVVVANTNNTSLTMKKREVRNLFMGRVSKQALKPVILPPKTPARVVFNTKVVGLTESRIQSYWAQMRFSGRNKPPQQISSVAEVIAHLLENENSVSYLPADANIPDSLTVIYSTN